MSNPLDPNFIKELSGTLYERLDIEGQTEELSRVEKTASRATLVQMLYDHSGESAAAAMLTRFYQSAGK